MGVVWCGCEQPKTRFQGIRRRRRRSSHLSSHMKLIRWFTNTRMQKLRVYLEPIIANGRGEGFVVVY